MNLSMIAILLTGALAHSAFAVPVFDAKCAKNIQLRAPPGGAGVFFDEDCGVAYVLPPSTGAVSVEAIARTSGLEQCPILNNFTKAFEIRSRELVDLLKRSKQSPSEGTGSPLFPTQPGPAEPGGGTNSAQFLEELEKLQDAYVKSIEKLKVFWQMPGASAQITYRVNHQALVDQYQRLNPKYTFRPITLHGSKIYLSRAIGAADQKTPFPVALSADIPGSRNMLIQTGELGDDQGIVSGDAQSGQILLSLFGACPMYNSVNKSMPSKLNARELTAFMTANISYIYELQMQRHYELTYNLGAFMRRLQSSESRGGFFSSKTINKLIVEENTKDWFEIKVKSEDGRFIYDNDFAQLMKAQAIDRALRNIAMFVQGASIEAPGLTTPKPNGAEVSSRELRKCPYIYCQVGAAILDVANAIFGNATSVSEYIRSHDTWVIERSEERRPLQFQGTVTFVTSPGV